MSLYVFHGFDRPGSADLRAELRPSHLEYQGARGNPVGGPMFDEFGEMCGSMFIVEAANYHAARVFVEHDPFVIADLFERWTLTEFRAVDWPI